MSYELLKEKLIRCRDISFEDVDLDDLEEISNINFSKKTDCREKIIDFIKSSKNPYMFKCNGKKIKIEYANSETKAEESLTNVVQKIYK